MNILAASAASIQRAFVVLSTGGVVAHATETCYGFAADLTNPDAVSRLFTIKERPLDQPVSALFPSIGATEAFVEWPAEALLLAEKSLPGPLTLILPLKKEKIGKIFPTPKSRHYPLSLGIRISSHSVAQELARTFGEPLSTTSANLHGKPPCYSLEEFQDQFRGKKALPDLFLDSRALPRVPPSKVITYLRQKPATLRP